ncbi:2,3,4,5-tetrahydropyridine-2,6-dicarboxylate N-succinyltransferase [Ferrimicrobium acidiphilum]|jgi:2,3,4,5-tetrahydropyridine-2-carboxylate N-succinyltransferase|uniref:2,3,4,5-tetrahydropyridine-2,6-dicarboxylate N-succinyltransferase n=1 Tax=Ferrimicrobium acidiphilum DSM 19497 TaxID=1121877 RepID=A0A0D8FWR3_9ACTN|nr:2,3,4,5-tetrahydropyridine-2,6-dicarboxylate N-succinyltransferase [Ferrimicrobium acidiphilum]KJE77394.1 2,3,4,5-tetrahydropyridine-2,6-dicarboxylate N-succinyltransferase [Ferrimicrobium acidiphilum DSM 19497]
MVLSAEIEALYERRSSLSPEDVAARRQVYEVLTELDQGSLRVAELDQSTDTVVVHEWVKKAILLSFRLRGLTTYNLGPFEFVDRLPLKHDYARAGVRVVPGASARFGSYLGPGVTLMPSYVNVGAWVGSETMVDTWATVGSCAQIGERVHLSGGVGIGGVLEPPQAVPVVIGDDAFVGSRAMVVEGARVGEGAVIGAGTIVTPTIPIFDLSTGEELGRGVIPAWSVAVTGTRMRETPGGVFGMSCILIVSRLDPGRRHEKTELNAILRDHGAGL